jgi:hypothetical protein
MLVTQIREGSAVIFLGAGASRDTRAPQTARSVQRHKNSSISAQTAFWAAMSRIVIACAAFLEVAHGVAEPRG